MSSLHTSSNALPQPGSYPGSRPWAVGSLELGRERRSKQQERRSKLGAEAEKPGRFLLLPWHLGPLFMLDSNPVSSAQHPRPVSTLHQ